MAVSRHRLRRPEPRRLVQNNKLTKLLVQSERADIVGTTQSSSNRLDASTLVKAER